MTMDDRNRNRNSNRERGGEAPQVTYDAVIYALNARGLNAITETDCIRRLSELSKAQIKQLIVYAGKHFDPADATDVIDAFADLLDNDHDNT